MARPTLAHADCGPVIDEAEIRKLNGIEDRLRRNIAFVALLDSKLKGGCHDGPPTGRPIIVGGAAVEFYTTGGYATQDVDIVIFDNTEIEGVLARSGFVRDGRYWYRDDLDALIEFPGKTLSGVDAYDRLLSIEVGEYGSALMIGLEDIFVDRIRTCVFDNLVGNKKWALDMASARYDEMDWAVVDRLLADQGEAARAVALQIREAAARLSREQ